MHELRRMDLLGGSPIPLRAGGYGQDGPGPLWPRSTGGHEDRLRPAQAALSRMAQVTDDELEEVLLLACELRQRVREQLHLMAPGEYDRVKLGVKMLPSGKVSRANAAGRRSRSEGRRCPPQPSVGEVIGLAVEGDHGCILRFEMQATKGSGRIVPLGSIQRVMRESIEAAAQYIKAKHDELGITAEWRQNFDVAVLATFMGMPKEGPSAGITIVTGIVSALKGHPGAQRPRHDRRDHHHGQGAAGRRHPAEGAGCVSMPG